VVAESDRYVALDVRQIPQERVDPNSLPQLTDREEAAAEHLPRCVAASAQNLEWIGEVVTPFSSRPVAVPADGEFLVTGWAVDQPHHVRATEVDVVVGNKVLPALYGLDRPDVAKYFGASEYRRSGFTLRVAGSDVGRAVRELSIRVVAADRSCYYQGPQIPIVGR
jgi:hypothetical protein